MRILVTGNAGSGKSTVAAQLASLLGVHPVGLDEIVWRPGWEKVPKAERDHREEEIANRPSWIVDGVSFAIQRKADLVIFLDCSRWESYIRCARRNVGYLFRSRPGLPENCPEILILPTLIRIIWCFPSKVRPKLLELGIGCANEQRFELVRSAADLDRILEEFRVDLHRNKQCE